MADLKAVGDPSDIDQIFRTREVSRPVFWYDVPEKLGVAVGVGRLGLVELSTQEVLNTTKRAAGDQIAMAFELAKEALRYVDQRRILTADGTADEFWASQTPGMSKLRQLVIAAYGQIHSPLKEDVLGFLASQTIKIG